MLPRSRSCSQARRGTRSAWRRWAAAYAVAPLVHSPEDFLQSLMPRQPAAKGKARNRATKARRGELFPLSAQPEKQRQHDCKQECNKSPAARRPVVLRRSSSYHFQVTPVRIPVDYPT